MGLIDGYQTRGIDVHLFDFDLYVYPTPTFDFKNIKTSKPKIQIPIPAGSLLSEANYLHVWQDVNHTISLKMWRHTVYAILTSLIVRPGADYRILSTWLGPAITMRDLETVIEWLMKKGGVREVNGAFWADQQYWRVLS